MTPERPEACLESGMASETISESEPSSPLDENGYLRSDLWLDQSDAHERIVDRVSAGSLSSGDAERLYTFVDDGYFTTHIDLDADAAEAFDAQITKLWRERPAALPISLAGPGGPRSIASYDGPERPVGYRLPDLHGFSQNALDLYLHPELFRLIELIFDQPAIAFQSLYFEYGSMQALHRDPMYVVTKPIAHLAAVWIALEDITPESGPLMYLPGSHRMPWFEFEANSVQLSGKVPQDKRDEYRDWNWERVRELGHLPRRFTCKRGDVFVWHGALQHGGDKIANPELTRKSFVVHYSTAANYRRRTSSLQIRDGDRMRTTMNTTSTIVETPHARGLDSPTKGRG
jgi:phytanoyl-CoA hydroxylase